MLHSVALVKWDRHHLQIQGVQSCSFGHIDLACKYVCSIILNTFIDDKIVNRFYRQFKIPGVLGCIDGTHVAIVHPKDHEERFFNRKGYHSLNVLTLCDAKLNILLYTIHGEDLYLLGDSGYPLRSTMMVPLSNPEPGTPEAHFQELHLTARSVVERCIGAKTSRINSKWKTAT
ncbi:hypothetical protein ACJJTC_007654 [Scirpophaga incertulas]